MIGLLLLGCHLIGDFVLQDRWTAAAKPTYRRERVSHVFLYALPFCFVAPFAADNQAKAAAFLASLVGLHYLTDSRRFLNTLGDRFRWRADLRADPEACQRAWIDHMETLLEAPGSIQPRDIDLTEVKKPPPNPWPHTSIMVDQSLHVAQVGILGAVFLT